MRSVAEAAGCTASISADCRRSRTLLLLQKQQPHRVRKGSVLGWTHEVRGHLSWNAASRSETAFRKDLVGVIQRRTVGCLEDVVARDDWGLGLLFSSREKAKGGVAVCTCKKLLQLRRECSVLRVNSCRTESNGCVLSREIPAGNSLPAGTVQTGGPKVAWSLQRDVRAQVEQTSALNGAASGRRFGLAALLPPRLALLSVTLHFPEGT